jgi:UDPglucose 6-dehydrogenase
LRLAALLLAAGAEVSAYDPIALGYAHNSVDPRIRIANDAPAVFAGSDAVVLMTAWPQFKDWRWGDLTTSMRTAVVIDGRNA